MRKLFGIGEGEVSKIVGKKNSPVVDGSRESKDTCEHCAEPMLFSIRGAR